MSQLVHCPHCSRHFRRAEVACPFCGAAASAALSGPTRAPNGASRSRVYVARAGLFVSAVFVACTDGSSGETTQSTGERGAGSAGQDAAAAGGQSSVEDHHTGETSSTTNEASNADTGEDGVGSGKETSGNGETSGEGSSCPGPAAAIAGERCDADTPCPAGAVCSNGPVYVTNGVVNCVTDPCACNMALPCDVTTCDGQCVSNGTSCGTCVPNCSPDNCTGAYECVENDCVAKPCDVDGGSVCGVGFRCDSGGARANAVGCAPIRCDEEGATECSETFRCATDEPLANMFGCVQKRCDEQGAVPCQQYTACRTQSPDANAVGCAKLRCDEEGGPSCSPGFGCRPEDTNALQNIGNFGCVALRCDEAGGPACGTGYDCAPDSQSASPAGCAPTRCDAGWSCEAWKKCDPTALGAGADAHGCSLQTCAEDADCACGYCVNEACSPEPYTCWVPEIVATPYGCVWPDDEWV